MSDTTNQAKTCIEMNGRRFEIAPPDGLIVIRTLKIIAEVLVRTEEASQELGASLAKSAMDVAEGKKDGLQLTQVLTLLSVLEEDDLLRLGSALLQFRNEREGVRWLQDTGVRLTPLMQALNLNLKQCDDIVDAIEVFTGLLGAAGVLRTKIQTEGRGSTGEASAMT
jgi:hypothetical protein